MCVVVACGMFLAGLLFVPWFTVWGSSDGVPVTYPGLVSGLDSYGGGLGLWDRLYASGLAVVIAVFAVLLTIVVVALGAMFAPERRSWWTTILGLVIGLMWLSSLLGLPTFVNDGAIVITPQKASFLVPAAHFLLFIACPIKRIGKAH